MENNLSIKIKNKLDNVGINYKFIALPENLPSDISSHVKFHQIEFKQAIPTLIYKTERGFIAVQRRVDTQINLEKLKKVAGIKDLKFASKEELDSLGLISGYVPLIGLDLPFYTDEKVLEIKEVYGGGGKKTQALSLNSRDLVKINNSIVGDFSEFSFTSKEIEKGGKKILSGITPSGDGTLHIGNYLGAVKQFIEFAKSSECFLMVADLHALTTIQNKETLQKNIENLVLNELALLGDLKNIVFFRQSDVLEHAELTWILNNVTPLGILKRAHAYKDKLSKDVMEEDINLGLFNYPVLMTSDILLYKPDYVPVGKDQKQHVEICRDIAERFNKTYKKNVFPLPEAYIPEDVAVVMGTDGQRKMSKSLGNIISIFEDESVIKKQVMSTYTDPTRKHATDPGHIEGNMVFNYLDFFGKKEEVENLKNKYKNGELGDVEVKNYLFEILMKYFAQARDRYQELKNNPEKVKKILTEGAEKARAVAKESMTEVRDAVGLTNKYSFFKY